MGKELPDSLKGIVITEDGKIPQKEVMFINEEETAQVLDDPVRFEIIRVLRKGIKDTVTTRTVDDDTGDTIIRQREVKRHVMSVVEIVKMSSKLEEVEEITKNQVYHHLPKLMEAGYVIKYGTITTGKRTTDYYARTAKGFVLTTGTLSEDTKMMRKKYTEWFGRMSRVFDLKLTEDQRKELVDLRLKSHRIDVKGRAIIAQLVQSDVADHKVLDMYDWLVHMHSIESPEYQEIEKRVSQILFSNLT